MARQAAPDQPLAVLRAQFASFNEHDVAALGARVAPDFVWYSVSSDTTTVEVRGREAFMAGMTSYFSSFPDVRSVIEDAATAGNYVMFRERAYWTTPSGAKNQSAAGVYEIVDGLIRRIWYYE